MDVRKLAASRAFTLIELLVVITVIAILMALLFPAFKGAQDQAKRTQAKNDVTQIVTAVNAFYTEYGKYPTTATTDVTVGGNTSTTNDAVVNPLRGIDTTLNPKAIVFLSPPDVKDPANPRSGIGTAAPTPGQYFDPWGTPYVIAMDGDYNNQIDPNPYSSNAGASPLSTGVIAWSFGKDAASDSVPGPASDKNAGTNDDDVISWQ